MTVSYGGTTLVDIELTTNSDPAPDIKANGSDGPITVSAGSPVSIAIALDPGNYDGVNADWWVAARTPFDPPLDWYTYVHPDRWLPGIHLCAQAPLLSLSPFEVLKMNLPEGDYTFYFALDAPDGQVTAEWLDSVSVTVE